LRRGPPQSRRLLTPRSAQRRPLLLTPDRHRAPTQSALADGRYDEAAKLRDEYRRAATEGALQSQKNIAEGR
jgi:hypothetical protein